MDHLVPVDIADQGDAYARELLQEMIEADREDMESMAVLGIAHSVSSLAVAFLQEVRNSEKQGGIRGREYSILQLALALAYAIRSKSVPHEVENDHQ